MYKAIKANRVVDIQESKAESYLAEGYSIFDKAGNLVLAPKTIVAEKLAKEVEALKAANAALTVENEALRTELAELKAAGAQTEPTAFKCVVCGKEYKSEKALTEHIAKVHPGADDPEK